MASGSNLFARPDRPTLPLYFRHACSAILHFKTGRHVRVEEADHSGILFDICLIHRFPLFGFAGLSGLSEIGIRETLRLRLIEGLLLHEQTLSLVSLA